MSFRLRSEYIGGQFEDIQEIQFHFEHTSVSMGNFSMPRICRAGTRALGRINPFGRKVVLLVVVL